MDEFKDNIANMSRYMKLVEQQYAQYEKSKNGPDLSQAQANYKKATQAQTQCQAIMKSLTATERQKCQTELNQYIPNIESYKSKVNPHVNDVIELPSQAQDTAGKYKAAIQYTEDARRNAQESIATGDMIVEKIKQQNNRIEGITDVTVNIGKNVVISDQVLNVLKKKEAAVTWILYGLVVLMLASDGLAFWLFHKN